jgi:rhamnogalacturonyl hydrolase YesR
VTGDKKYADFAAKRYQFFADNLPALSKWPTDQMRRNPFRNMLAPTSLDACGAMGASMTRAARNKVGPDMRQVIDRFAEYVSTKQFRLEDGLLARKSPFPKSIWLDDAYMSVPLLAQYGKLTGERKYFDDAAKQLKGFHKHLFVPEVGLFTHAGNADVGDEHPHYYWGRANGWFMVATVELLDLLPADHPDREELIKILKAHAKGVATLQSGKGLWHQMLDRPDSYLETSCTAMFAYSMAKGVNRGWLDASTYGPVAIAGWNGITTRISGDGRLDGVCVGTNYANDYTYYYNRPAMDDVHGYGPTLLCGAEMIRLLKNEKLEITGSATRPVLVVPKKEKKEKESSQ